MSKNNLGKMLQTELVFTTETQPVFVDQIDHGNADAKSELFNRRMSMVCASADMGIVRVTSQVLEGDKWLTEGEVYWTDEAKLMENEGLVAVRIRLADGQPITLTTDSQASADTDMHTYDDEVNRGVSLSWTGEDNKKHSVSFIPDNPDNYVTEQIPDIPEELWEKK